GRLLEPGDRVLGDIVGPVVDIERLVAAVCGAPCRVTATGGKEQGAGEWGETKTQGHGGTPERGVGIHATAADVRAGCGETGLARVRAHVRSAPGPCQRSLPPGFPGVYGAAPFSPRCRAHPIRRSTDAQHTFPSRDGPTRPGAGHVAAAWRRRG